MPPADFRPAPINMVDNRGLIHFNGEVLKPVHEDGSPLSHDEAQCYLHYLTQQEEASKAAARAPLSTKNVTPRTQTPESATARRALPQRPPAQHPKAVSFQTPSPRAPLHDIDADIDGSYEFVQPLNLDSIADHLPPQVTQAEGRDFIRKSVSNYFERKFTRYLDSQKRRIHALGRNNPLKRFKEAVRTFANVHNIDPGSKGGSLALCDQLSFEEYATMIGLCNDYEAHIVKASQNMSKKEKAKTWFKNTFGRGRKTLPNVQSQAKKLRAEMQDEFIFQTAYKNDLEAILSDLKFNYGKDLLSSFGEKVRLKDVLRDSNKIALLQGKLIQVMREMKAAAESRSTGAPAHYANFYYKVLVPKGQAILLEMDRVIEFNSTLDEDLDACFEGQFQHLLSAFKRTLIESADNAAALTVQRLERAEDGYMASALNHQRESLIPTTLENFLREKAEEYGYSWTRMTIDQKRHLAIEVNSKGEVTPNFNELEDEPHVLRRALNTMKDNWSHFFQDNLRLENTEDMTDQEIVAEAEKLAKQKVIEFVTAYKRAITENQARLFNAAFVGFIQTGSMVPPIPQRRAPQGATEERRRPPERAAAPTPPTRQAAPERHVRSQTQYQQSQVHYQRPQSTHPRPQQQQLQRPQATQQQPAPQRPVADTWDKGNNFGTEPDPSITNGNRNSLTFQNAQGKKIILARGNLVHHHSQGPQVDAIVNAANENFTYGCGGTNFSISTITDRGAWEQLKAPRGGAKAGTVAGFLWRENQNLQTAIATHNRAVSNSHFHINPQHVARPKHVIQALGPRVNADNLAQSKAEIAQTYRGIFEYCRLNKLQSVQVPQISTDLFCSLLEPQKEEWRKFVAETAVAEAKRALDNPQHSLQRVTLMSNQRVLKAAQA